MKEKLVKLLDLKSILTIISYIATVVFTYKRLIGPELFISSSGAMIGYYFSRKDKNA